VHEPKKIADRGLIRGDAVEININRTAGAVGPSSGTFKLYCLLPSIIVPTQSMTNSVSDVGLAVHVPLT